MVNRARIYILFPCQVGNVWGMVPPFARFKGLKDTLNQRSFGTEYDFKEPEKEV